MCRKSEQQSLWGNAPLRPEGSNGQPTWSEATRSDAYKKRHKGEAENSCPEIAAPKRGDEPGAAVAAPAVEPAGAYFTIEANTVTNPADDSRTRIEIASCRCSSRFCSHCCKRLGIQLRERLIPVLETFSGLLMITLTIDPQLFPNPETAYTYTREKRLLARLVRRLFKAGYLKSKRFAYVLEFQKITQMPHWHLLVEGEFVPHEKLAKVWNSFRPKWAGKVSGKVAGERPGFGHCYIKKNHRDLEGATHGARYVTKYLTKIPEAGYPDWVLDFHGQIRLFATSRCFFEGFREPRKSTNTVTDREEETKEHEPECFCERCRESGRVGTIRERLAKCGSLAQLFEVHEEQNEDGDLKRRYKFLSQLPVTFDEVVGELGDVAAGAKRFFLRHSDFAALQTLFLRLGAANERYKLEFAEERAWLTRDRQAVVDEVGAGPAPEAPTVPRMEAPKTFDELMKLHAIATGVVKRANLNSQPSQ